MNPRVIKVPRIYVSLAGFKSKDGKRQICYQPTDDGEAVVLGTIVCEGDNLEIACEIFDAYNNARSEREWAEEDAAEAADAAKGAK